MFGVTGAKWQMWKANKKTSEVRAVEMNKILEVVQIAFRQVNLLFFLDSCLVNVNSTTNLFVYTFV